MNKLLVVITVLLLAACNADYPAADTSLNGTWIAVNETRLKLDGMSYTKTTALGNIETGTFVASDGLITFSRPGHTSETMEYRKEFPRLQIGAVTYYHDSPSEPVDIEGIWYATSYESVAVIFGPGKRIKDENKKETLDREGEFRLYMHSKGNYYISSRNLPGQDRMVTIPTHVNGIQMFDFLNTYMPINLIALFDQSVLIPPETYQGVEEWWFSIEEIRKYFEDSAGSAGDLETRALIYYYSGVFFDIYGEPSRYDYTVEYDEEYVYRYPEMVVREGNNKLSLRMPYEQGAGIYTYLRYNGTGGVPPADDPFWWAPDDERWNPAHPDYPGYQPYR